MCQGLPDRYGRLVGRVEQEVGETRSEGVMLSNHDCSLHRAWGRLVGSDVVSPLVDPASSYPRMVG